MKSKFPDPFPLHLLPQHNWAKQNDLSVVFLTLDTRGLQVDLVPYRNVNNKVSANKLIIYNKLNS